MKPALLLVDLQKDYLASPGLLPVADIVTSGAAALLTECRRRHIPIVHIWTTVRRNDDKRLLHWKESNRWLCEEGAAGHCPPITLCPLPSEAVAHKSAYNPFSNSTLDAALKKLGCNTVIVAGVHLHACVRAAVTECLERGLRVFIAEDAIGSNDPVHAAATRRWLAHRCVQFDTARNILDALGGATRSGLIHHSPRESEQVCFDTPISTAAEIAATTESSQSAWIQWGRTNVASRCRILEKIAIALETTAPQLARQMAIEIGKPLSHGLEEGRRAAANVRDVIRRALTFEFQTKSAAGTVRHDPLGVVALISPWNNPVAIPIGKIVPALAYGNTVVWKPSPAATNISATVLKVLRTAGVPRNAVQIVTGDHATAQSLAANELVNAVTLTSSPQAGFTLAEICAGRCVPLQAELSGNNASIVWDEKDSARAAAQIAFGAFGFAGQRCTANRRVIVKTKHADKFVYLLKSAAEKLVWDDPTKSTTDIGPVISTGKRDEHRALILAAEQSSDVRRVERLLPERAAELSIKGGAYAQPVIICCDKPNHLIVQEESMSPILVVQRANSFDEAVKLCNGVRHGLIAALFTKSPALKKRFLAEAQSGMLKINSSTVGVDVTLPFGGWKASALGPPEHGEADRLFYTRMKTIYERD